VTPPVDVNALLTEAGAIPRSSEQDGVWPFLFRGRRGWLWLEDKNGHVVAHLSLLVADGIPEVQEIIDTLLAANTDILRTRLLR
jgi:hypothetical protein